MRINNNVMALNAHRQLGINQSGASKSMEKLSSGFRINRAGDDAAGLAISEKMRGQIRGLKQAARNAQDGISLIQTAEGALNETHAILQRMRELAVQASTDTNTMDDRKEIQKEINQLLEEIDRIAEQTEFNTQPLLDGTYGVGGDEGIDKIFHIGANEGQNMKISIGNMATSAIGKYEGVAGEATPGVASGTAIVEGVEVTVTGGEHADYNGITIKFAAGSSSAAAEWSGNELTVTLKEEETYTETEIQALVDAATGTAPTIGEDSDAVALTVSLANDIEVPASNFQGGTVTLAGGVTPVEGGEEGDGEAGPEGIAALRVDDVDTATTGGVLTQAGADAAIKNINHAITDVSAERSKLGAIQNRLEHTIANLGTSAENLQAAESRIRDLDMAEEIMAFTKNNILQQAATAMLAQANMAPQSVLQLLG